MATTSYVLGYSPEEHARLARQANLNREGAVALLDRIGVQPGWRVADLGCGPVGILELLAERVGPTGSVVGLDQAAQTVALARAFVAGQGLTNVRVEEGDAGATGLPRASFDLVHARLVLCHTPDPQRILTEMVALIRPGGMVAVQDIDATASFCEPPHPAYETLMNAYQALLHEQGQDARIGRRLFGLLRSAGLADVDMIARSQVLRAGTGAQAQLPNIIRSVGARLVARGYFTEAALVAQLADLEAHLAAPDTITLTATMFQAWGHKPV